MKKNKGFTLIELLAVIVILAIIAIIAVPVILNVIEKSKIGAAEQSAQGYIDAVEKQIVTNKVKNESLIEEGEYTKSQLDEKNVKIKGEITDALVVVGEKGRVTQGRFCINGYSIDYDGKKAIKNSEASYCNEIKSILNTCPYEENQVFNFDYTGNVQEFTPECEGKYKLEVWGAQGGNSSAHSTVGGKGGYSVGIITLTSLDTYYIYVGGAGTNGSISVYGGWNGGGGVTSSYSSGGNNNHLGSGGGATDISTIKSEVSTDSYYRYVRTTESYNSRIIVAGGGGGAEGVNGGYGGGTTGGGNYPGTQSAAGQAYINNASSYVTLYSGGFGYGVSTTGGHTSHAMGACGGGGYYGGGVFANNGNGAYGSGGSGYVNTALLTDASTIAGNQSFKAPNGTNETGHSGNGYARITYLGEE